MEILKLYATKFNIFVAQKIKDMFGIGGGELVFILFIVLMLFGSDKVPEIARTMGKAMAQLKNATNDIKSEIHKGAEANGLDTKSLTDITGNINAEINSAKSNILGDSGNLLGDTATEINKVKEDIDSLSGPIKRQM
jgi:sec-independent protein translocase protein TatA